MSDDGDDNCDAECDDNNTDDDESSNNANSQTVNPSSAEMNSR